MLGEDANRWHLVKGPLPRASREVQTQLQTNDKHAIASYANHPELLGYHNKLLYLFP